MPEKSGLPSMRATGVAVFAGAAASTGAGVTGLVPATVTVTARVMPVPAVSV